jgi:hypothetical protein
VKPIANVPSECWSGSEAKTWEKLSPHAQNLLRAAAPYVENKIAERWAGDPNNRSLADKLYRQGSTRLSDATRQHVSPLDGRARERR